VNIKKLESLLIRHEDLKLFPYICPAGKLTIGVGRNLEERGISYEEAMFMLANDITDAWKDLSEIFIDFGDFTEDRQCALVDMIINLGRGGFEKFVKTIAHIKAGEWEEASIEMLDSRWASQVGYRAEELSGMIKRGNSWHL